MFPSSGKIDGSSTIPVENVIGAEKRELQGLLKAVVQSVEWTYSLFWQFYPQKRELVWGDGYYNGAIKTRKTTHPAEVTAEEAAMERSQQLRELCETLLAGDSSMEARACTALSPEDLTETEWFYVISISTYSFAPPSGMPGKAYARRKHVWLSGANEVDCKIFCRAILAKSAKIQTVVCIPVLDGVLELGTTNKVKESKEFVEHIKSFFHNHPKSNTKPALFAHFINEEHEDEEEEEEEMTMSEEIRLGSPDDDDVSNQNLLSDFHIESTNSLDTHMDMMNLMEEGANYSLTVSTLLMSQPTSLLSDSVSTSSHVQSSFVSWRVENAKEHQQYQRMEKASSSLSSSQWMLKHIILRVPFLHDNTKTKRLPREELTHVVAERRRREKLNERFITLRSLVPFVTKMDKVSILGDTIEYVNQLCKRIHELESIHHEPNHKRMCIEKVRTWEEVEVSIIETDVLLEMRCEYRDGLLLDILQVLKELGIDTTAVHTAVNYHKFEAEIRAKMRGKKPSIADVKRAIHQITSNNKL